MGNRGGRDFRGLLSSNGTFDPNHGAEVQIRRPYGSVLTAPAKAEHRGRPMQDPKRPGEATTVGGETT